MGEIIRKAVLLVTTYTIQLILLEPKIQIPG